MPPHPAAIRVGEAERDQVVERLKTAFAEGRLDHAEFDLRTHLALTARTRADLAPLLADVEPRQPVPVPSRPTAGERSWALLAHWLGIVTSFVGPLVILLSEGRRSRFVRHQAAESLNFQLTFLIANFLLVFVGAATLGLGMLLYIPLVFGWMILTAAGGIGALVGEGFRYPVNIRMVR